MYCSRSSCVADSCTGVSFRHNPTPLFHMQDQSRTKANLKFCFLKPILRVVQFPFGNVKFTTYANYLGHQRPNLFQRSFRPFSQFQIFSEISQFIRISTFRRADSLNQEFSPWLFIVSIRISTFRRADSLNQEFSPWLFISRSTFRPSIFYYISDRGVLQ
jgi:hypothetical protein